MLPPERKAVTGSAGKYPVCSYFGDVHCDMKEGLKEYDLLFFLFFFLVGWE